MKSRGNLLPHPVAFWLGCAALVAGVLSHPPMFLMASHMHYRMVGMPMDTTMLRRSRPRPARARRHRSPPAGWRSGNTSG